MILKEAIKELEKQGYDIKLRKGVYRISGVANLEQISVSESIMDYRIGLWQLDENNNYYAIHTAIKEPEDLIKLVNMLTF